MKNQKKKGKRKEKDNKKIKSNNILNYIQIKSNNILNYI